MEDKLIELLQSYNYKVIRQGSLPEDAPYPTDFFTFWSNESLDHAHYDNLEYGIEWDFEVNFYSDNPQRTYDVIYDLIKKLKQENWIVSGRGYDVGSDVSTHTGRGIRIYYLEVN